MAVINHGPLPSIPSIDNPDLFLAVFTHKDLRPTSIDEPHEWGENQRLAELGSQVLNNIVTFYFFSKRPLVRAEEIRTWRIKYTCEETLNGWLDEYQLKQKLCVPPNQRVTIYNDIKQMASYFNSYLGAVYLTRGLLIVQNWITSLIDREMNQTPNTNTTPLANNYYHYPMGNNTNNTTTTNNPQYPTNQASSSSSSSNTTTTTSGAQAASQSPSSSINPSNLPPSITVSLVNQIAAQMGMNINYYPSMDGPSHLPTWTVRCYINNVERGVGTAQNQKLAKEEAARWAWITMGW